MNKRQLAWSYIVQSGRKPFTGTQIVQAVEMNHERTRCLLAALLDLKKIEVVREGECPLTARYKVIDKSPIPNRFLKKKRANVRQRLWNSCRVLKVFSLHDLCSTASAALSTGRAFLRPLIKAKIVRKVNADDGELFRLNVNKGVESPVITQDGVRLNGSFYPFQEL